MRRIGWAIAGLGGVAAAASTGCEADLPASFDSPDTGSRLRAVVSGAQAPEPDDLRGMVAALGSDDPALRSLAIAALDRTVGERFGYDAWAAEVDRQRAIDRWNAWLARREEPTPRPAETP